MSKDRILNEFLRKMHVTPTLRGNLPGQPLFDHYANMLPPDLPKSEYGRGLSCFGFARLIVKELGGSEKAKIFWVQKETSDGTSVGHAFVVPVDSKPSDMAYNNTEVNLFGIVTSGEVLKEGVDITDDILDSPWKEL